MADVQPDASQVPAPEKAPEPAPASAPEPAPEVALQELATAAVDTAVAARAEVAEPALQAAESAVESTGSTASAVADAVIDAVDRAVNTESAVASTAPELESTTLVPATEASGGSEGGGEWELLLGKVQDWLGQGKLQALWAQARNPISLILAAAALLVVLRVYSALLAAIDSLPLIPGLLELVGVIWAVRFGVPKLVQRSQRQELISSIQQRWESFRGRG